ncbi:hypothetical protein K504DRAFT_462429 [Pleomassaria siparia CBS 279.74]|uniref:Uncharacterized protein n=1 Tax=Pleomassaria siparia CBS 279.74 TaxID=1314801 RepID=A0A6G1KMD7_9PLEO|nr:hypothetical protein K504DRAFT_462429 [Pleomassaria siparia CBS 279.74]
MTATKKRAVEQKRTPEEKQKTPGTWLTRRLRKPASRQENDSKDMLKTTGQTSLRRSQTAPSGPEKHPTVCTANLEPPLVRPFNRPPPRPPRPDSSVVRDVNAWLDASMIKPAPTLMAGIPYWRVGAFTGSTPSSDVRYAVSIVPDMEHERPTTSRSQHLRSFCRRAKRMRVRMPTFLRTKSQRVTVVQHKKLNRQSTTTPLLSMSSETRTTPTPTPALILRCRSLMHTTPQFTVTTTSLDDGAWLELDQSQILGQPQRHGSPVTVKFDEQESHMERRINAGLDLPIRIGGSGRPSTATTCLTREDSMGNLSDAPTYCSGPPPPSYRSRAASVMTTSSFGCVDGMDAERRHLSQQKAATQRDRGVKGKIKKLAQRAHLKK